MNLILIILLFVVAWIVLIMPKQRELKRHQALLAALSVGDEVMTGSGIYGTIVQLEPDIALLQVAPGIELKVARRAIVARVEPKVDEPEADSAESNEDGDAES